MRLLFTLHGQEIYQNEFTLEISAMGIFDVDADGSPRAYAPEGSGLVGLDYLGNAKDGDSWCGIVTDEQGNPVIQGENDLCAGYYVSPTTLQNKAYPTTDPRRYVDSEKVAFAVINGYIAKLCKGIVIGCRGEVLDTLTGISAPFVVADIGPRTKIGEGSIMLANQMQLPSDPKTGGCGEPRLKWTYYPNQPADGYELQPL